MKIYIKSDSHNGYLYIFKHGLGPGTIPKDVAIVKEKDLPNGYTAVWLDRFLRTNELKAYDIPSETRINELLDRIGYCQKNGDVVPCDEVGACDVIASTSKSSKSDILDSYVGKDTWLKAKLSQKAYFRRGYTGDEYWIRIVDKDEDGNYVINRVSSYKEYKGNSTQKQKTLSNTYTVDKNSITLFNPIQTATTDEIFNVDACDKVTASKDISCYKKYADALAKQGYSKNKFLKSLKEDFTDKDLEDLVNNEADLNAYIAGFILNSTGKHDYKAQEEATKLADKIISDACDKVTAAMEFYVDQGAGLGEPGKKFTEDELKELYYHLCIHEGDEICNSYPSFEAWLDDSLASGLISVDFIEDDVDYPYNLTDDEFDVESEYFDDIESCDKITASTHRYSAGRIEEDGTEDFYYDTGFDSYDEAFDWGTNHDCTHIYDREKDEFIPINSCDTKYFANMVSASNDPELDDDFLIEGYYDNQRRGLAESAETSDVYALNELANEYANKGYYIVVHNLTEGTITEFSADNWFDDIARDGGATLFMSW